MTSSDAALMPVNMLWMGGPLGPIERLSLRSFVANGHPVRLHVYAPVESIAGVEVRDGRLVVPLEAMEANRYSNGSYALASNLFRYALLARGEGLWADIDVVCIRPIRSDAPVIVGRENETSLNGAVLWWRADLPIATEALEAFRAGHVPEWLPLRRKLLPKLMQFAGLPITPRDLPHGTFGPKEVTALVRQHGLTGFAKAPEVFYPLAPRDAPRIFDAEMPYNHVVTDWTLTIHLWHEKLRHIKNTPPAAGSLLHALFEAYGH